jgi:hypothetical protein
MLINFTETIKKLSQDQKALKSYQVLEPKYALIRSLIQARINSDLLHRDAKTSPAYLE